jgi:hypothetical protein
MVHHSLASNMPLGIYVPLATGTMRLSDMSDVDGSEGAGGRRPLSNPDSRKDSHTGNCWVPDVVTVTGAAKSTKKGWKYLETFFSLVSHARGATSN